MHARGRSGRVLWLAVRDRLRSEIVDGSQPVGTRLPTEAELMRRFGVSRHTVRRAVAELELEGLVRVEQGRGTFVYDRIIDYALSCRTRFSENLLKQGLEPSARSLRDAEVPASETVARWLRVPTGEPLYQIVRVSYADDVIVSTGEVFYPMRRFPGLPAARASRSDVSSVFAEYGIDDYVRLHTTLTARLPTEEEARTLCQPKSRPVTVVRKLDADLSGTPIAFAETVWASDRVQFSIDNSHLLDHGGGPGR